MLHRILCGRAPGGRFCARSSATALAPNRSYPLGKILAMTPDERAARTFARQHGAIGFDQALAAGLSPDQIHHRVRTGRWGRPAAAVYVVAGSPDTPSQRAMVAGLATARAGGLLSHLTAAAIHGLTRFPFLPHVTVPPAASHDSRAAKVHRGSVPLLDRAARDGLAVTSVSRTLADCGTIVDRATLEELVDAAFCRRLATSDSVGAAMARAGARRRGAALVRSVTEVWSSRIEPGSVAEVRLVRLLGELGLTGIVTQHEVRDAGGALVGRLDVACPSIRAGLEYDSLEWHNPRRWDRDEPRYRALRAAGWAVDSITKLDLLPGERRLRDIVEGWQRRLAA